MQLTVLFALLLLAPWLAVAARMIVTNEGRSYLVKHGSKAAIREALSEREMALAFVGLIFAGLALATSGGLDDQYTRRAALLLTMALGAAVIAWTATNVAGPAWSGMVVSAGLLFGVGSILLAAAEILGREDTLRVAVTVVIGGAYVTILTFSIYMSWRNLKAT